MQILWGSQLYAIPFIGLQGILDTLMSYLEGELQDWTIKCSVDRYYLHDSFGSPMYLVSSATKILKCVTVANSLYI